MTILFENWQQPVYRAHNPRWSYLPESGEGAKRCGGRFNRPGTACLYTSVSPKTAWLEAQQGFPFKSQPLTLCAYEVDCAHVLDLTSSSTLDSLEITPSELDCPWEDLADTGMDPPGWRLADRLIALGTAAIVVPSFASKACADNINVVFWQWSRQLPHRVQVIDDELRLPKDDRSWS